MKYTEEQIRQFKSYANWPGQVEEESKDKLDKILNKLTVEPTGTISYSESADENGCFDTPGDKEKIKQLILTEIENAKKEVLEEVIGKLPEKTEPLKEFTWTLHDNIRIKSRNDTLDEMRKTLEEMQK